MAQMRLAPILTVKRNNFEKAFKILMTEMISANKLDMNNMRDVNRELVKWLVTGMQNVDFKDDIENKMVLEKLVDELWNEFFRDLTMKIRKYRTDFKRKTI